MPVLRAYTSVDIIMWWLPVCLCVVCAWITWIPYVGGTDDTYHRIFWNTSNSMFHASNNDHVIDVNLDDTIDIICPHYTQPATPHRPYEHYVIYMVDKIEYDTCVINDTSQKLKLLNCSTPNSNKPKVYTMLVLDYQPIQGNPDFREGKSYYFISTSGGGEREINNQYHGACYTDRMKMIMRVVPRDNSKPATPRNPSTITGGGGLPRQTTTTTSTSTSTTTPPRPTTTTKRTTTIPRVRPSDKPSGGGGDGFPNDNGNVIHVGGGGDKNEGTITDSAAPPSLHCPSLPALLLLAGLSAIMGVLR